MLRYVAFRILKDGVLLCKRSPFAQARANCLKIKVL